MCDQDNICEDCKSKDVQVKEADAIKNITEHSFKLLDELRKSTRNQLWIIGIIIAVLGFFGYSQISDKALEYTKGQIKSWLQFEGGDSKAARELDTLRIQAMLNAYISYMARSSVDPFTKDAIKLKAEEVGKLLELISSPRENKDLFNDAVKVLSEYRNSIFPSYYDMDDFGKRLLSAIRSNNLNDRQKLALLDGFWNEYSLQEYSREVINNNYPDNWKISAFKNLSRYDEKNAAVYAEVFLGTDTDTPKTSQLAVTLAKFLAEKKPESHALKKWVNLMLSNEKRLMERKENDLTLRYIPPAISLAEVAVAYLKSYTDLTDVRRQKAITLFSKVIDSGVSLEVDGFFGQASLAFKMKSKGSSAYISDENEIERLINPKVFSELSSLYVKDFDSLFKLVDAFSIRTEGSSVMVVQTKLSPEASLILTDGEKVNQKMARDFILLEPRGKYIDVTWVSPVGTVNKGTLKKFNVMGSTFRIQYNETRLLSYVRRQHSMF